MKVFSVLVAMMIVAMFPFRAVADIQAKIDSLVSVRDSMAARVQATAGKADLDTIIVNRPKLAATGITVLRDRKDGMWVEVDFPVSAAAGYKKAALKFAYWHLITVYRAQPTDTPFRCRLHRGLAKEAFRFWSDSIL